MLHVQSVIAACAQTVRTACPAQAWVVRRSLGQFGASVLARGSYYFFEPSAWHLIFDEKNHSLAQVMETWMTPWNSPTAWRRSKKAVICSTRTLQPGIQFHHHGSCAVTDCATNAFRGSWTITWTITCSIIFEELRITLQWINKL